MSVYPAAEGLMERLCMHMQAASPPGAAAGASAILPAANPPAAGNEGAVDPNLLQNLLTQLQGPQQSAQV